MKILGKLRTVEKTKHVFCKCLVGCSNLHGYFRQISGKCPAKHREMSGKFPGNVRERSGKNPENFRESSGKCPGYVREMSGKCPGFVREIAGNVPGIFREMSGNFSGPYQFPYFPFWGGGWTRTEGSPFWEISGKLLGNQQQYKSSGR